MSDKIYWAAVVVRIDQDHDEFDLVNAVLAHLREQGFECEVRESAASDNDFYQSYLMAKYRGPYNECEKMMKKMRRLERGKPSFIVYDQEIEPTVWKE